MGDLAQKPLLEKAPTTHAGLLAWVEEVAELTQPDRIYWVDGSEEENTRLTDELVAAGTLTRLNPELFPNSFAAFSDPADVARVEEQTFICSEKKRDAGSITTVGKVPTVGEWLTYWAENIAEPKVRASTLQGYQSKIAMHLIPGLGEHRLDRLPWS